MSLLIGNKAESIACAFLEGHGYHLVQKNFRCTYGEIDLIMEKDSVLVFVEVRKRTSSTFGYAIESITPSKIEKIKKTATFFLQGRRQYDDKECRFDVMALDGKNSEVEWLCDAFD